MKVVAITAIKGGVGKSTVARLIALQAPDPTSVIMIDTDAHPSSEAANKIALGAAGVGVVVIQPERAGLIPKALAAAAAAGATLAVIDTPPRDPTTLAAAAKAADFALVISRPNVADMLRVPETLTPLRGTGVKHALLFNCYPSDHRRREIGDATAMALKFGVEVAPAALGQRVAFERIAAGETLPRGDAIDEAERIYRYVQSQLYN